MKRFLLTTLFACILSSCSLLPHPGEPIRKYTLQSVKSDIVFPARERRPCQLTVDLPTLYPPIDNTRIALKPQMETIDYYADVEWADRLSTLLQESFIYSLQNTGKFQGVSRPTEGLPASYAVKVEVRKFYIDQSEKEQLSTARVDYMVHLVKLPERHIVTSRQFTYAQTVPENTIDAMVKSLNTAHLEASRALTTWVLAYIR